MKTWHKQLHGLFERADDWSDAVRNRLRRFDGYESLLVVPFLGMGTKQRALVRGRILETTTVQAPSRSDSVWINLRNMYHQFETDEVPNARVKVSIDGSAIEVETDDEGYFEADLQLGHVSDDGLWHDVHIELLHPTPENGETVKGLGKLLVPPQSAKFGIISDIDDTVLVSGVGNKLKMVLTTVLSNAYTRVPFEGVSEFYNALHKGAGGADCNPLFYVSSSPYNLYSLLLDFLTVQRIPLGPVFLRDFGVHTPFTFGDHDSHKIASIRRIFDLYPDLEFVLIGDDGEKDPDIYARIVSEYPGRVRAIYIRSVNVDVRQSNIATLVKRVQNDGSQLVLVPDSASAAVHAAGEGLISADTLSDISAAKETDKTAPSLNQATEDWLIDKA